MKRYDSYKDSGVEWIGEIPIHWEKKRLKHITKSINGYSFKSDDFDREFDIPVIRIGDVGDEINFENCVKVKPNFLEEKKEFRVIKDDILIGLTGGTIGKSGKYNYDFPSLLNQRVGLLRNKESVLNGLLYHYVKSEVFIRYIFFDCYGGGQDNISMNDILNMVFPYPPLSEQQQIVSFLDTKTSLIDSLIEKTQRKIELLKEKRTSLINEVVTKGLNPNVEMRDSGVEWIGEIPSHWGRTKLKRYVSIFTGYSFKSDWFGEEGIPVIRISNIQDGFIDFTKSVYLTENYLTEYPDYVIKRDDTLICLTGSLTGKVGKFNHEVGLLNQRVGKIIVRGNKVLKGFIDKVFFFQKFQGLIKEMGEGISENFPNVSHLDVVELEIPLPPFSEQEEIVSYLDEHTQLIDKTISIEEKRTELLKEYRQSLISEVVTGKRKVEE